MEHIIRHQVEESEARSRVCCVQVDILSWRNKTQRVHTQVKDICAILSGLVVAQDYRRGQALVVNRNFADNAEFFQVGSSCLVVHDMGCLAREQAARASVPLQSLMCMKRPCP